jgi:tRNA pseudouridine55 synthase
MPRKAVRRMPDGILSVDKPRGMTSHDAVEIVRRASGIRAVGHTGTLDPEANGVLLLCLGRATKFAKVFEVLEKTYWVVLQLGVCTDTQDAAGKVVRIRTVPGSLSRRDVESVLPQFTGCLKQTPPMYSALKQGGQRLYRLARQGYTVDRPARDIFVRRLQLLEVRGTKVTLAVTCSKGTYVRTLGEDIGLTLGYGAHVTHLQRCRVGAYALRNAYPLTGTRRRMREQALNSFLIPTAQAVAFLPSLSLSAQQYGDLQKQRGAVLPDILREACPGRLSSPHYRLCTSPDNTVAVIQRRTSDSAKWKLLFP